MQSAVQSSKNETRYLGRLSNYRKNTSKTDGGYLISGHGRQKQQKRTSKHILFRIDGDAIWSGVDLNKPYVNTVFRAPVGCVLVLVIVLFMQRPSMHCVLCDV